MCLNFFLIYKNVSPHNVLKLEFTKPVLSAKLRKEADKQHIKNIQVEEFRNRLVWDVSIYELYQKI